MKFTFLSVFLITILSTGCILDGLGSKKTSNPEDDIQPPALTLGLPVTLSGAIAPTQKPRFLGGSATPIRFAANTADCFAYFSSAHSNFMENGYELTRFLVGLSQSQSCFADQLMRAALVGGKLLIGKGVVAIPSASTNANSPTHIKIDLVDQTYKVWIFFATAGSDLPSDTSTLKQIYITWTTDVDAGTSGRFYMVNLPPTDSDPNAPRGIRVDFSRTAVQDKNEIYIKLPQTHSAGMSDFRVDVIENNTGVGMAYEAKGLIVFGGEILPFATLPATETFAVPAFGVVAVLDGAGAGAAQAIYNDFAMRLASDGSDGKAPFDFGSYQFDINDKSYFNSTGYINWRNKSITQATYVNTSGQNARSGTDVAAMKLCLELGCPGSPLQLGSGYFTNTCTDANRAECTALIAGLYNYGLFGAVANDAFSSEPSDTRSTSLTSMVHLQSAYPDQEDGSTTFVVPVD